jgi:hypothetical protein
MNEYSVRRNIWVPEVKKGGNEDPNVTSVTCCLDSESMETITQSIRLHRHEIFPNYGQLEGRSFEQQTIISRVTRVNTSGHYLHDSQ